MKSSAYLRESHSQRLGAAEEQEPERQLGGCSSLSRLWAPCAGWRQALVFHMSLPLPVLKCPGALCFPGPRVGSVTQELATPAVLAGTEGQDHGVWNVLYIFPDQDCLDLLPLSPSFVLDKKKIAVDLHPGCSGCPDRYLPFWSKQILSWEGHRESCEESARHGAAI